MIFCQSAFISGSQKARRNLIMMKDVAVIIHDGVQALDVAGPLDVFAEATALLGADDGYSCQLLATSAEPVRASNGMTIVPNLTLEQAPRRFDIVLVAGGPALSDTSPDYRLSAWLKQWAVRAERYGSICTGAFTLGHAGLLDQRTATTH